MRENRLSGSEGGATLIPSSLPLSIILSLRDGGRCVPAYLSRDVMTIITTSTRMKLRSSQRGRSGPDNVTQATIARIRQINDQEIIVRKRCMAHLG